MKVTRITALLLACAAFAAPAAKATTITFDEYGTIVNHFQSPGIAASGGFLFKANSGTILIGDNENTPDSGSTSMLINGGSPASVTMTSNAADLFSLDSFRVSEGRNMPGPYAFFASSGVTVLGQRAGGGTVSASFVMDGLASNNAASDFQLFKLVGFDQLSSATFSSNGYSFSIDDIALKSTAVPEPATIALFGFALLGLASTRRRKQ